MEYSPGQLHTSLIFTLLFYFSPPLFFLSRFCSYGGEFADHVRSHLAQFHLSSLLSQILSQIPKMADEHEDEVFTFLTNQQREYNANLDNLPKWTNRTGAMKAALGEIEREEKVKIAMATVYNRGRDDKVEVFFKELIDQVEIIDDAFNKHMEKCNADEKRVKSQYDEACFDIYKDVKAFEKRIDRWRLMLKERYRRHDKALIEAKVDYLENAMQSMEATITTINPFLQSENDHDP